MQQRTALITGGAGFIGSHVAAAFLSEGYSVDVIDDLSTGVPGNIPSGAMLHVCDIRSPAAADLIRSCRFDVICHLAAHIDVRSSVLDPITDASINISGTLNLLEAVRAYSPATRFIFSSTGGAIYGDSVNIPTSERSAKNPVAPYGTSKLSTEYYLSYFSMVHGLDTVTLRYANVYGPRQDPHGEAGVVAIFCERLLNKEPLIVYGDGTQTRDFVFVEDVARANLIAATAKLPKCISVDSRAFNIGTSVETSVIQLASELERAAHIYVPVQYAPARTGEQARSAIDYKKSYAILGWEPTVNLSSGLGVTFDWFSSVHSAVPAALEQGQLQIV